MKFFILLASLVCSLSALAQTKFAVAESTFSIKGKDALHHVEQLLLSPSEVLTIFEPRGGKITNRQVQGNRITFNATKKVAFISKTVFVQGNLESAFVSDLCRENEIGFRAEFDLTGSDDLVFENVSGLVAEVCIKESKTGVEGRIWGHMIKGPDYSKFFGGTVREVIESQVPAFVEALQKGVQNRQ